MSGSKKSIRFLGKLLCIALLGSGVCADIRGPLDVELTMAQIPALGQQTDIDCTLQSSDCLKNVALTIDLPEGVELVSGELSWQGDMLAAQQVKLTPKVKITTVGNKNINAKAYCWVNENASYGDMSQLFFHSAESFSVPGYVLDVVPTETKSESESGASVVPRELTAQTYTSSSQETAFDDPCAIGQGESAQSAEAANEEGMITVTGKWHYYDRKGVHRPLEWVEVELLRGSDDTVLTHSYICDGNGQYTMPPVGNPGADGLKVRVKTYFFSTYACDGQPLRIVDWAQQVYTADTEVLYPSGGTVDFGTWSISRGSPNEPAWWLMQDIVKCFWWPFRFNNHESMAGGATVVWYPTSIDGNYNIRGGDIHLKAAYADVCDVVMHEYGHEVMWDGYGSWLPWSDCPPSHYINRAYAPYCAWLEGFATWYKCVVSGDPSYHWPSGACLNFETPSWNTSSWDDGDWCEGRVCGALWDIGDEADDGWDTSRIDWEQVWLTWYGPANRDNDFASFWARWKNQNRPTHEAVKALYQNTIDYNDPPSISGIPDVTISQDTPSQEPIDLWAYASDVESKDSELIYAIEENTDSGCRVSIDSNGYLHIEPAAEWLGLSVVTLTCSDGIRTDFDCFAIKTMTEAAPFILSELPNVAVPKNTPMYNAIDLWPYANNPNLNFAVTANSDLHCTVYIESNRFINIEPAANWTGNSFVTIRATDLASWWEEDMFEIVVGENCDGCSDVRSLPDGEWVLLDDKQISASFRGMFYIADDPDRVGGIRVSYAAPPTTGTRVSVAGQIGSHCGERSIDCHVLKQQQ